MTIISTIQKILPLSITLFFTIPCIEAQRSVPPVRKTSHQDIFLAKMKIPNSPTMAKTVLELGKSFRGNPYPKSKIDTTRRANGTVKLQPISEEVLVVNLRIFDCVTFVENMIALSQTRRSNKPTFDNFKGYLRKVRYRNGEIDYAARLHYFSDWLYENEKRGILKNITQEIGGDIYDKNVFYMSLKKDTLYGNMADSRTYARMLKVEQDISNRLKYYIPKDKVADIESKIKDGDIIGITNRLEGMDMAHAGIAVWVSGRLHMIHASSQFRQVLITDVPLADYLSKHKSQTGIMIGRLQD